MTLSRWPELEALPDEARLLIQRRRDGAWEDLFVLSAGWFRKRRRSWIEKLGRDWRIGQVEVRPDRTYRLLPAVASPYVGVAATGGTDESTSSGAG